MPNDTASGRSKEPAIPSGFLNLNELKGETETKWLWPDKIPIGHVAIVAGEASSGKSLLAAEIAAHASRGAGWGDTSEPTPPSPMPPGTMRPGSVLIAHSNQHENLVLKRRLLAAGADASRVNVVNRDAFERQGQASPSGHKRSPDVTPVYMLEGALMQLRGASLVVVDDLQGWLGQTRLKPEELTEAFKRLANMAARYGVALVVLWRLEKGGRAAQTRQLDALSALAPVVWLLAGDTYSAQTRLAVCAQNRLGAQAENLTFGVEGDRLVWRQAARQVSADDVLAARTADRPERRQAGQWLLELLSHGPIKAKQLFGEARACGLAERTVRRAADELDLHPKKDGKRNVWLWGVGSQAVAGSSASAPGEGSGFRVQGSGNRPCDSAAAERPVSAGAVKTGDAAAQNVAALPEVGSLANAGDGRDNRDGYDTKSGSLANAGDGRDNRDGYDTKSGSLANADDGRDNRDGYPTKSGSLASGGDAWPAEPDVAELICRSAATDPEEQKLLAALAADDGEASPPSAESVERERRRLRRERRFIEKTLSICRGG